jgi:hypothetical protein
MGSRFKDQLGENNLRHIDWSEGKANPKTFTLQDFDEIINSKMYLARKFDTQIDFQIIDKLKLTISR